MTLRIDDIAMTSDRTAHTARQAPDRNGWEVSWLPGQTLDRNTAITAMTWPTPPPKPASTRATGSGPTSRAGPQN